VVEVKCCLIRQTIYKAGVSVIKEYMILLQSEQSEPQKFHQFWQFHFEFLECGESPLGTPATSGSVVTASDDR
jgi:hypothetical protein